MYVQSKRSICYIVMMTYVDGVRKKKIMTSTLSHLLLKLRAIKVDISMSKEPF